MFTTNFFIHIKRFIPRTLQILIRRALVFRNLPACSNIWPIDPQSSKPPEGWKGWPEGKKFAFIITHDVETEKGLKRCRQLMDIEERMGFRSSFNFVAGDYNTPMDLINEIKERGFEVGVHGLYHKTNIHKSKKTFTEHAVIINSYLTKWGAVGFRTPSMYHNLDYAHDLNIEYDASTFDTDPFEPQPDGVGTIFPFWVSGNHAQQGYVELPYTLPQDFLLFILMKEKNINIWKFRRSRIN